MTLATALDDLTPVVEPGQETSVEIVVRNTGDVVDQFTVDVVGAAAQWSRVEPATVNLMPGDEAALRVVFAPPRASDPVAGRVPYGVRVRSREDPGASSVHESHLEVAAFTVLTTELLPAKRRARRRGTYRLLVENTGNTPTPVRAIGLDPEGDQVVIGIDPAVATVAPATAVLLRVRVSPQRRLLRGQPINHLFELEVTDESPTAQDPVPLTAGGTLVQQPLLPRWLLPALLVLLGLVIALVVLWFALLKPAVESIATERAQEEIVAAAAPGGLLEDVAAGGAPGGPDGSGAGDDGAGDGADDSPGDGAGDGSGDGSGGSDGADPGAAGPGDPAGDGTDPTAGAPGPIGFRIATDAPVVSDGSFQRFTFDVPAGRALDIGDLVLQNPRGDTGFLRIVLNDEIVIEAGLANFRDLDYHYVTPLRVAPGTPVVVAVNCVAPGTDATRCTPAVSFSGTVLE